MTDPTIDNQIRRLRFDAGEITQAVLAETVGVTRQTIVALEAGQYLPSLELAMKLAAAFGCDIHEVFFWADAERAARTFHLKTK